MAHAQPGIFSLGAASQVHLEFDLRAGADSRRLAHALAGVPVPHSTVSGVNRVVGFRPALWAGIAPDDAPRGVHGFDTPLTGADGYTMPATQHDAWVWLTGASYDVLFDVAREVLAAVAPFAVLAFELAGWSYRKSRDLTGFEDGTGNPDLLAAPAAALVADGRPGAGASIVLLQQWRHDTAEFDALDDSAQERVIGRTKVRSEELDDDAMPRDAHVPRTTLVVDGEERPVFRRSVPWGSITEHGLMFVGFAGEQWRLQRMLERMAGREDGVRDALTHFSIPLTGSYYVVPSADALRTFAPEGEDEPRVPRSSSDASA